MIAPWLTQPPIAFEKWGDETLTLAATEGQTQEYYDMTANAVGGNDDISMGGDGVNDK